MRISAACCAADSGLARRRKPEMVEVANRAVHTSVPVRVACLYFAAYLHLGVIGPFLPLWFAYRGLPATTIGLLIALPLLLRLPTAPFISSAGRKGRVRSAIGASAGLAALLMLAMGVGRGTETLLVLFVLFNLAWISLPPLIDTYALMGAKGAGYDFGRVRFWGSFAFLIANATSGFALDRFGLGAMPFVSAALLALPILLLSWLPSDRAWIRGEEIRHGDWRVVLADRSIMLAIAAVALIHGSHALLLAYSSIGWARQGMSPTTIGVLWAIGLASEMLVLWFGNRMLGRRDPSALLIVAGCAAALRWAAMAASPSLPWLCLLQLLQGLSAMAAILGVYLLIARRLPNHLVGAAQAAAATTVGIVQAAVLSASGPLWNLGAGSAYATMTGIAVLGIICSLTINVGSGRARMPIW